MLVWVPGAKVERVEVTDDVVEVRGIVTLVVVDDVVVGLAGDDEVVDLVGGDPVSSITKVSGVSLKGVAIAMGNDDSVGKAGVASVVVSAFASVAVGGTKTIGRASAEHLKFAFPSSSCTFGVVPSSACDWILGVSGLGSLKAFVVLWLVTDDSVSKMLESLEIILYKTFLLYPSAINSVDSA